MADAALIDRLKPGDHLCWTFADDTERRQLAARYVRGGLRQQHKVIYFASAVSPAEAVDELAAAGIDAAAAIKDGRMDIGGSDGSYLAGGQFDGPAAATFWRGEIRRAQDAGFPAVRALGDMSFAAPGLAGLPEYEADVNRLHAEGFAAGLCLYDRRRFGFGELIKAAQAHPTTVGPRTPPPPEPMLRMIYSAGGLILSGETDLSNREAFAAVVSHLAEDTAGGTVTIDVHDLAFADAPACRQIVAAAQAGGGRMRVVGARPVVRRLLELHGAAAVPGLLDDLG
jgi:anti-anti-sigma factor